MKDASDALTLAKKLSLKEHITMIWTNVYMGNELTSTLAIFSFKVQVDKTESLKEDILTERNDIEKNFVRPAMARFEESQAIAQASEKSADAEQADTAEISVTDES